MFHCQFEALAEHRNWTVWEKVMHLLAILQGQAADILQCMKTLFMRSRTVNGDRELAAVYCSQQKGKPQLNSELLQEFAAAMKRLAHWTLVRLPE
jgi:hypothetical protein